tara:strand:- start:32453 stop:33256 length:804 start_codon:yes stop_codon:yes gene_type:complete
MDLIQLLGYFLAILIGLTLGLIGSGGSILTVPILVYLLAIEPVLATAYSLFIVGITALVGLIRNIPKKQVDFKTGIIFAIPAFFAVYITRKYLLPAIPESLFFIDDFEMTKNIAIMVFFAIIMLLAAVSMIRNNRKEEGVENAQALKFNYPLIIIEGIVVGVLTGLVGAGGGFLIIPALVLLAKLPMKKAVATSLMIIAVKSLIGFIGDVQNLEMDWAFLLSFSGFSVVGIFIGIFLNQWIDGKKLKTAFGWFVLLMAAYILIKEFS